MSDLQCPATLLILGSAGWPEGAQDLPPLAAVYADPARRQQAAALAATTGAALQLRLLPAGPDGRPGSADIQLLSDLHRGETVGVLPEPAAVHTMQLRVDADGWAWQRY